MIYDIILDVGGSGIKGAYYSVAEDMISDILEFVSHAEEDKEVIITHMASICSHLWEQIQEEGKQIGRIRMAFPGPFEYELGIARMKGLAKYESLYGVCIPKEMIALGKKENYNFLPRYERDYKFINDVEAFAMGAMHKRRLFQGSRVLYLCIGTGAGSAYSIDGQISKDRSEGIPENGWIYPISFKASQIDDYISVRGIKQLALNYCNNPLTPLELSKLAGEGNIQAIKAYQEFGDNLNAALFPLLTKFKANTLVLGGKISRSGNLFLEALKESCDDLGVNIIIENETSELILLGLTKLQ